MCRLRGLKGYFRAPQRAHRLGVVIGVNRYILRAKVAAQGGVAASGEAEIAFDADVLSVQMAANAAEVEFAAGPAGEDQQATDPDAELLGDCLLYTSPSPRDGLLSRMPSSA